MDKKFLEIDNRMRIPLDDRFFPQASQSKAKEEAKEEENKSKKSSKKKK